MKNIQITILKGSYLIEKFLEDEKKFIILAEHKTLEAAQKDMEMWRAC